MKAYLNHWYLLVLLDIRTQTNSDDQTIVLGFLPCPSRSQKNTCIVERKEEFEWARQPCPYNTFGRCWQFSTIARHRLEDSNPNPLKLRFQEEIHILRLSFEEGTLAFAK